MREYYGQGRGAVIALHGGAGSQDPGKAALAQATAAVRKLALVGLEALNRRALAVDVVVNCLKGMELDEQFNAGRGSALQADGQARLTAALMDGSKSSFSGVISTSNVLHPSVLARALQAESARVLTDPGAELLARKLGLPVADNVTAKRRQAWFDQAGEADKACDTVGCIVRTSDGRLFAGTSTGGRGFETPGRVSDSCTVAGTYCSNVAGISATGFGEEIVDDALAARLETRRRDGMSLEAASHKCLVEASAANRRYGWIAVDRDGFWAAAHTTPEMTFVILSEGGEHAASG